MALAGISLVAPYGLLACALALVPLGVVALAFVRQRRVARALELEPAGARGAIRAAALPVVACLMLGVATAQPTLTTTAERSARTSSEVVFLTDVSLSMLAAPQPASPTRLDRARSVVEQLRGAVPEVPAGISGLTDRALPYLFPTLDRVAFTDTLVRSVQPDAPMPQGLANVATSYAPLSFLVRNGFYSRGTKHRTCVLVTDGETRGGFGAPDGCRLLAVRVGSQADRIFQRNGKVVAAYRPESTAASTFERLARISGGEAFSEGELVAAAAALRKAADVGPRRRIGMAESAHSLAPIFAALALAAVALVVIRRYVRPAGRASLSRRDRVSLTVGI
jgi:hypothetical protein